MKQILKIILIALLVVASYTPGSFVSPKIETTQAVSGASYTNITNYGPAPADYRPFRADSAWNVRLPDNPQNIDSFNTPIIKNYAANSDGTLFMTEANDFTSCFSPCYGLTGSYPMYVATNSDPAVTIDCTPMGYGCSIDSLHTTVSDIPGTFHIPANARGGGNFGDVQMAVLQPDGTELDVYGCRMDRDWQNGDVIAGDGSGTCWASGVAIANVVTGYGYNNSVDSGDAYTALMARYNEVVPPGATINHPLRIILSCFNGNVYPGSDLGVLCSNGNQGVPTGALIHLNLTHAQIDSMSQPGGTLSPYMRPFYYALHDYGAYPLDGGDQCPGRLCMAADISPRIEDAAPWVKNGATNPWIPWFQAQGAGYFVPDTGQPVWAFRVDLYQPIANNLEILSTCYSQGTCSDSLAPGNPPPTPPPGPPPPPVNCPTAVPSNTFTACYFNDQTLTTPALTRTDSTINFNWGTGSPGAGVNADHFSARWQGNFNFNSGNYTFTATADDGVRIYVDGNLIINQWIDQGPTTYTATANMSAGTHLIKVEYYENTGGASVSASWTAAAPPVQELIGQWKLDEASGTTAADASGKSHPGTLVNGPVWTAGRQGNALSFDGVNDYASMGNIGNTNTAGMSVSFWVNYPTLPGAWKGVISKAVGGGNDTFQYVIGSGSSGSNIMLSTSDAAGQYSNLCPVSLAGKTNQWLHYVFIWSADSDNCKVYENNVLVSNQNSIINMNPLAAHPLELGRAYGDSNYSANAKLDEVRIYNYLLSASEVAALYNLVTPTPGDLNMDHIVNSIDWSIMNSKWFTSDASADLNHDGIVNAIDYSILNANWFKTW